MNGKMKKKILALIGAAVLTLGAGSCSSNTPSVSSSSNSGSGTTIVQRYTVAFEVDGERYKTVAVKEGETIAESIAKPYKENHVFIGWMEGNQLVDLATYVVTKNTTFTAKFEVQEEEDVLNVDDVKEADALYTLVLTIGALANSLGLVFILIIHYFVYFKTGTVYYGYYSATDTNEMWLYINMVFPLVVMMFLLPIFNRLVYKKSGNVYFGALLWCMIFVMMSLSASISFIPM